MLLPNETMKMAPCQSTSHNLIPHHGTLTCQYPDDDTSAKTTMKADNSTTCGPWECVREHSFDQAPQKHKSASCDSLSEKENSLTRKPSSTPKNNMLANPCGKEGFQGWRRLNYTNASWKVESSTDPPNKAITTNFVSTHSWCCMEQTVDLTTSTADPSAASVEVSARFRAHKDCPSMFRLRAEVLDANKKVLRKLSTRMLSAPSTFWDLAFVVLKPTPGTKFIRVTLQGKDGRLMPGHYGSKVTDCCVHIVGDAHSKLTGAKQEYNTFP